MLTQNLKKMQVIFVILILIYSHTALSEEPFCNNKCHDSGLTLNKVCSCDLLCASVFNDCCGDSEKLLNKFGRFHFKRNGIIQCKRLPQTLESVMVIDKCSRDWKGPDNIRDSCTNPSNSIADPLSLAPVTNVLTGTTYSNYFCAICNAGMNHRIFWNIKVNCPTLDPDLIQIKRQEIFKYIYYNKMLKKWGVSMDDDTGTNVLFHICDISFVIPSTLNNKIRRCDSELVSKCLPSWKDDLIKRMCDRYIDPVYVRGHDIRYRNLYCAICNRENFSDLSCGRAMGPRQHVPGQFDVDRWNFALLLDVDTGDGNDVGKNHELCGDGNIYDPFLKKCLNTVCILPGMKLKDDKCVPSNASS